MLRLIKDRAISIPSGNEVTQPRELKHGLVYSDIAAVVSTNTTTSMQGSGICIIPESTNRPLPASSRVNYAKVYNVDHKRRVKFYGKVDGTSLEPLLQQWKEVSIWMYKKNPEAFAKAVHEPSLQSLVALYFTPKQAQAVLDAINSGCDSRQALIKIAESSAAKQLRSEDAADLVSSLMLSGLGYSAAVSCARHHGIQSANARSGDLGQAREEFRYDDLDTDDGFGAEVDPGSSEELSFV